MVYLHGLLGGVGAHDGQTGGEGVQDVVNRILHGMEFCAPQSHDDCGVLGNGGPKEVSRLL